MEAEERTAADPPGADATGRIDAPPRGEHATPPSNERCAHHGGRQAVARCDVCGEPVCLGCAIPVRGRVLGPGCVAEELGDPALVTPPEADRGRSWVAVAGALVAVLGTAGPWTRTGAGDRLLGAWVPTPRWSLVAAVAAVALVPLAWRWAGDASGRLVVLAFGLVAVVGSLLAITFPPTFQAASWGPWVTAVGGAVAAGRIWVPSAATPGV